MLFREVFGLDCILPGYGILMPSCYNLLLHRHELHQKSLCESPVLFCDVLWLDCILQGCCTLMPSCYNLLLDQGDVHQKSFCGSPVLFHVVVWLDCILQGCCAPYHLCRKYSLSSTYLKQIRLCCPVGCMLNRPIVLQMKNRNLVHRQ